MILLDTTVLVYAKGEAHPLRESCRELIAAITERRLDATTTVEVIQEFVHVRARRRDRTDAVALGRDYAALLSPLLSPTDKHVDHGLTLFQHTGGLGAFDAVLAAVAADTGVSALVSADTAFAGIQDLRHIVPNSSGVAALLSG
ncbi:MAG: type II toxin-antitoxin system VapC family toxin [Solirubrobacterales bacterium]